MAADAARGSGDDYGTAPQTKIHVFCSQDVRRAGAPAPAKLPDRDTARETARSLALTGPP
jgi:hypothetical protein